MHRSDNTDFTSSYVVHLSRLSNKLQRGGGGIRDGSISLRETSQPSLLRHVSHIFRTMLCVPLLVPLSVLSANREICMAWEGGGITST